MISCKRNLGYGTTIWVACAKTKTITTSHITDQDRSGRTTRSDPRKDHTVSGTCRRTVKNVPTNPQALSSRTFSENASETIQGMITSGTRRITVRNSDQPPSTFRTIRNVPENIRIVPNEKDAKGKFRRKSSEERCSSSALSPGTMTVRS